MFWGGGVVTQELATCREERNEAELIMYAGHRVSGRAGTRVSVLRHGGIAQLHAVKSNRECMEIAKGKPLNTSQPYPIWILISLFSLFLKKRPLRSLEAFSYGTPPPCLDVEALQSANILSQSKLFWS